MPRVSIDRLVIARESWSFTPDQCSWATAKDELMRFAGARAWRKAHGIPERAFYKVPTEDKPTHVDFGSIPLVNILAKAIRQTAEVSQGFVHITEMLPDLCQTWLTDGRGARYTAELRIVAVDKGAGRGRVHSDDGRSI
jgi:hypothetical protein